MNFAAFILQDEPGRFSCGSLYKRARTLGYWYSVVLGNEKYYSRAGYSLARKYGILAPFGVPDENFMVCKLLESTPSVSGVVQYAKEFGIN